MNGHASVSPSHDELGPKRYRARRGVEIAESGWLRKTVDCSVEAEVAKANAMHAVLRPTPFRAPTAKVGDRVGTILLEDLGSLVSVTELAESACQMDDLDAAVTDAARILSTLHAETERHVSADLIARYGIAARWPFEGSTLLHGDYSPTNVFRDASGGAVTLDGSPNFTTSRSPLTFGRPETDIATFTLVLCWPLRPMHWRPCQVRARLRARRRFVATYNAYSASTIRWLPVLEVVLFVESIWFRKILRGRAQR